METLKPLGARVLIKRLEQSSQTAGGLILPEVAKDKLNRGRIVAVGEDVADPKEGETVIFGEYSGNKVELAEGEHLIMESEDVLAVVEESPE